MSIVFTAFCILRCQWLNNRWWFCCLQGTFKRGWLMTGLFPRSAPWSWCDQMSGAAPQISGGWSVIKKINMWWKKIYFINQTVLMSGMAGILEVAWNMKSEVWVHVSPLLCSNFVSLGKSNKLWASILHQWNGVDVNHPVCIQRVFYGSNGGKGLCEP